MKRRIILINFPNKFVEEPKLPHERKINKSIKEEIVRQGKYVPEFFEILLDHYDKYLKDGLILPPRFAEETNNLIQDNDPIGEWMNTFINFNDKSEIQSSLAYDSFCEYINNDNTSRLTFKNYLINKGVKCKRKMDGVYFIGIKFKADQDD